MVWPAPTKPWRPATKPRYPATKPRYPATKPWYPGGLSRNINFAATDLKSGAT